MKKTFYLLRHGQTVLNTKHVCQGSKNDSPLTEMGILQTDKAKEFIKKQGYKFDIVYSSPLKRAIDTAILIAGKEPIIDEGLIEIDFGDLTGMDYELSKTYSNGFEVVNGESFDDAEKRIENCLKRIYNEKGENILCVSHGFITKLFKKKLIGIKDEEKVLPNLGIMIVEYDGVNFKFIDCIDTQI